MNTGGDAAEQVVRLSLDGVDVALRLTGSAAKNMAILIYTLLKDYDQNKTKGKTRMAAMLKSGKPLTVFGVRQCDMRTFVEKAKSYGVNYCMIKAPRGSDDGIVDVIVYQADAARIDRIVRRFGLAVTNGPAEAITTTAPEQVTEPIVQKRTENPQPSPIDAAQAERILDDLFGDKETPANDLPERIEVTPEGELSNGGRPKNPRSENSFSKPGRGASNAPEKKPSVRKTLQAIDNRMKKERQAPVAAKGRMLSEEGGGQHNSRDKKRGDAR